MSIFAGSQKHLTNPDADFERMSQDLLYQLERFREKHARDNINNIQMFWGAYCNAVSILLADTLAQCDCQSPSPLYPVIKSNFESIYERQKKDVKEKIALWNMPTNGRKN